MQWCGSALHSRGRFIIIDTVALMTHHLNRRDKKKPFRLEKR